MNKKTYKIRNSANFKFERILADDVADTEYPIVAIYRNIKSNRPEIIRLTKDFRYRKNYGEHPLDLIEAQETIIKYVNLAIDKHFGNLFDTEEAAIDFYCSYYMIRRELFDKKQHPGCAVKFVQEIEK